MARRLLVWGAPTTYVIAVLVIAFTLIGVLLRSPDTKANFQADPSGYDRTELAVIGSEAQFQGLTSDLSGSGLEAIYVGAGCAGCHGLSGEGSAVGPEIWDHDLDEIRTALRDGAFGMPAYSESSFTERQIGALTTYLNNLRLEIEGDAEPTPNPTPPGTQ